MRNLVAANWLRQMENESATDFAESVVKTAQGGVYPPAFGIVALTRTEGSKETDLYFGQAAPCFGAAYFSPGMKRPKVILKALLSATFVSDSRKIAG